MTFKVSGVCLVLFALSSVGAFTTQQASRSVQTRFNKPLFLNTRRQQQQQQQLRQQKQHGRFQALQMSSAAIAMPDELTPAQVMKQERKEKVKKEGGLFAFDTKFGALNPFAIYYGVTAIFLGLFWFSALSLSQLMYFITRNRFDKLRRLPVAINHIWGVTLMRLTRCTPEIENKHILKDFYKQGRAAMMVSNHNSWMDIPFIGSTIGWRNYKMIAKKELIKVPILGKAIRTAANIEVDRTNRRSQIKTLKTGMKFLDDGVHLCTFPEGTRTKTGRLNEFKNGAFLMALKSGSPVIPLSIVGAGKINPYYWMFPFRPARGIAKVIVHEPIESKGKTEGELASAVRRAIIQGLPADQRPLDALEDETQEDEVVVVEEPPMILLETEKKAAVTSAEEK